MSPIQIIFKVFRLLIEINRRRNYLFVAQTEKLVKQLAGLPETEWTDHKMYSRARIGESLAVCSVFNLKSIPRWVRIVHILPHLDSYSADLVSSCYYTVFLAGWGYGSEGMCAVGRG